MTEPARPDGLTDPEIALHREAETLAQRFPGVDHEEIEDRVRSTYDELKEQATVDTHLVAMIEGWVTEQLRQEGETVHVRGEDADRTPEARDADGKADQEADERSPGA